MSTDNGVLNGLNNQLTKISKWINYKILSNNHVDSFKIQYPFLNSYINNSEKRNMLTNNQEFIDKYERHDTSIYCFCVEYLKYFTYQDLCNIIEHIFIDEPEDKMAIFLESYLNSRVEIKNNKNAYEYFNYMYSSGEEVIEFILKYGIMTKEEFDTTEFESKEVREEKQKRLEEEKIINQSFIDGNYATLVFKGHSLFEYYRDLDLEEKKYLMIILKNNLFSYIFDVYEDLNSIVDNPIKFILRLYSGAGIDEELLLSEMNEHYSKEEFVYISYFLINEKSLNAVNNVKYLIMNGNYNLVRELIHHSDDGIISRFELKDIIDSRDIPFYNFDYLKNRINRLNVKKIADNNAA